MTCQRLWSRAIHGKDEDSYKDTINAKDSLSSINSTMYVLYYYNNLKSHFKEFT